MDNMIMTIKKRVYTGKISEWNMNQYSYFKFIKIFFPEKFYWKSNHRPTPQFLKTKSVKRFIFLGILLPCISTFLPPRIQIQPKLLKTKRIPLQSCVSIILSTACAGKGNVKELSTLISASLSGNMMCRMIHLLMNNNDVLLWNDKILKDNKEIPMKQKNIISNSVTMLQWVHLIL